MMYSNGKHLIWWWNNKYSTLVANVIRPNGFVYVFFVLMVDGATESCHKMIHLLFKCSFEVSKIA